jgi:hypothetical protein
MYLNIQISKEFNANTSMDEIIISQPWGGLGDNLQFSTLPELYSNLGYKVFISNNNACRNKETYDLVWKLNPYISGISEKAPNAGSIKGIRIFGNNPVKNMELSHNLNCGNRKYLKLYYKPKYIEDLSNTLLYDITSISTSVSACISSLVGLSDHSKSRLPTRFIAVDFPEPEGPTIATILPGLILKLRLPIAGKSFSGYVNVRLLICTDGSNPSCVSRNLSSVI